MSDHNENCAIYHNSIDECDCERGQIRALRSKLAVAVDALEAITGENEHESSVADMTIAKEALAKIRS